MSLVEDSQDVLPTKGCDVPGCSCRRVQYQGNWTCGPECRKCTLPPDVTAQLPKVLKQPERRVLAA